MNYFKYLQYIPLVLQLIAFIRAAQGTYKEAGSGSQRLKWVAAQFAALVTQFEMGGILNPKLAAALREGSEAIITIIVQCMKAADGEVVPGPLPEALPAVSANETRPNEEQ